MMIRKPPVRLLLGFEFMARRRDRRGLPHLLRDVNT
jgi:hypothetical protein